MLLHASCQHYHNDANVFFLIEIIQFVVAAVAVVIIIPICNEMLCFVAFFFSRVGFGTKPTQKEAFKRFCLKKTRHTLF